MSRSPASQRAREERRKTPQFREAQYFRMLYKRLGVTREQYEEMWTAQAGRCAICLRREKKSRLCVDHNHRTGQIRGLLCRRCNSVLGYVDDGPTLLRRMMRYLERHDSAV